MVAFMSTARRRATYEDLHLLAAPKEAGVLFLEHPWRFVTVAATASGRNGSG
jgi:hypothetical protein